MKLLFKQRIFSWLDSYDIYDEFGDVAYTVQGQLSWGHCFKIFDCDGNEVAMVKQKIFTLLPKFEFYYLGEFYGYLNKEFSFFKPRYYMDFNGWYAEGSILEWDYSLFEESGNMIARVSKDLFRFSDTYVIDVPNEDNALCVLMFVLAIDAEKCSRSND